MCRLTLTLSVVLLISACRAGAVDSPSSAASSAEAHPSLTLAPSVTASASAAASPSPKALPTSTLTASPHIGVIPSEPTGPEIAGDPVRAADIKGAFTLTLVVSQDRYRAGQAIEAETMLTYDGAESEVILRGSGHSLVGFALEGGNPPVQIAPAYTSDCAWHRIGPSSPLEYPFVKSGGWDPQGRDYTDFFAAAYFAEQDLRLPAGTWTITAATTFYTGGDCGEGIHTLTAAATVTVEP